MLNVERLEDRLLADAAPLGLPVREYTPYTYPNGRQALYIQPGNLTRALTDAEVSAIQQWNQYDAIAGAPLILLGAPGSVPLPPQQNTLVPPEK